MLSRLIGTDRIEELAGELTALRADVAAQARGLADLANAADVTALKADVAELAARVELAVGEGEALSRAMKALDERIARWEARADEDDEQSRADARRADEAAARVEAERDAQRLEIRKLQMRLDAHFADMAKTATTLVRQMAALRVDEHGHAAGPQTG